MERIEIDKNPIFEPLRLSCIDCGFPFVFSVGEQSFYYEQGLTQPRRCPKCRQHRRQTHIPDSGNGGKP